MSDITLSQGIRQNLLSLQDTAANLTTTQEHLATGKKINTAFDNPTSYFVVREKRPKLLSGIRFLAD
jgi:flagellin